MTESLQDRLLRHEGVRLKPYKDSLGKLTIGVGRCLDTKGISRGEALFLLANDIAEAQDAVHENLPWADNLDPARLDVLYEACFQLGIWGLLGFKEMLAALEAGDYDKAAQEMLDSNWHKQTSSRVEELAKIIIGGKA